MKIFVFGNQRVKRDSLPLRILPKLRQRFPKIQFIKADPTELLDYRGDVWILDTAEGINDIVVINDFNKLNLPKRFSAHDYDLAMDLSLIKRLGKVDKIRIIALPMGMKEEKAIKKGTSLLVKTNV